MKRVRRKKEYIEALKRSFKEKCCFKDKPIPTETIFDLLGFDYSKVKDRQFIYRCVSKWVRETLAQEWNIIPTEGSKDITYQRFLEKCVIEEEPFGYFDGGFFYTPRTYGEYEALLNKYAIRSLLGCATSLSEMATKGMMINSRILAEELLTNTNKMLKLIEVSEDDLLDYHEEALEE